MNKLIELINKRKVGIYKFLDGIRAISRIISCAMCAFPIIFLFVFLFHVVKINPNILQENDVAEFMQQMVLIPLDYCFCFLTIYISSKILMYFIVHNMDEDEKRKVGMVHIVGFVGMGERSAVQKSFNSKEENIARKDDEDGISS